MNLCCALQAHTPNERSQAINIWWWRRDGPYTDAELQAWDECPHRNKRVTIRDCQFGYEGPPDHPQTPFNPGRMTRCKGLESVPPQKVDAHSSITHWQRFAERRLFALLDKAGYKGDALFSAPIEVQTKLQTENQKAMWAQQRPPSMQPLKQEGGDEEDGDEDDEDL